MGVLMINWISPFSMASTICGRPSWSLRIGFASIPARANHCCVAAVARREKTALLQASGQFGRFRFLCIDHREQGRARGGQGLFGGILGFVEGQAGGPGEAEDLSCGTHFGTEDRINLGEHVEREDRFLDPVIGRFDLREVFFLELFPEHDAGGDAGHGEAAYLGNQGDGPGGAGIGLENVNRVVADSVLDVHEADHVHGFGDPLGIVANGFNVFFRDIDRRQDTGRIPRVDAGQLDVFHDGGNKSVGAVGDGVGFTFQGVLEEAVHQDRPVGSDPDGGFHVLAEHGLVMDDFHTPAAEYIRRAHHEGIAETSGNGYGIFGRYRHVRGRHGNSQGIHDGAEAVAVLGQVDGFGARSENRDAGRFKFAGDIQGRLAAELTDHSLRFFLLINAQNVFHGERFEIELVRGVVIGGDGLRGCS